MCNNDNHSRTLRIIFLNNLFLCITIFLSDRHPSLLPHLPSPSTLASSSQSKLLLLLPPSSWHSSPNSPSLPPLQPVTNNNPWMLLYFISFLLIVSFFVLNMFVGVVVENFHKCRQHQEVEEARRREEKRQRRMEKKRRSKIRGAVGEQREREGRGRAGGMRVAYGENVWREERCGKEEENDREGMS